MDDVTQHNHGAFLLYRATGEIVGRVVCDEEHIGATIAPENLSYLPVENYVSGATHYIRAGAIMERPANSAVLDGMTLRNLPVPCTIMVNRTQHGCNEPTVELSFSHPGTYPVTVSAWPMLDATFQVTQS